MKFDAKQRICLALVQVVVRVLFPFDETIRKAWSDFFTALEAEAVK